MAIDITTDPIQTDQITTDSAICRIPGCGKPVVRAGIKGGRHSTYCSEHKPQPRERKRGGDGGSRPKETKEPGTKEVASLHEVVTIAVAGLCLFVPPPYHPTSLEVDNIFQPLERIYLRHATVPTFNPDVPDALAAIMGMGGYIARVSQQNGGNFRFGRSFFNGSRRTATQAANAPQPPQSRTVANGRGVGATVVDGAKPDDYVASVMASLHAETLAAQSRNAAQDQDEY